MDVGARQRPESRRKTSDGKREGRDRCAREGLVLLGCRHTEKPWQRIRPDRWTMQCTTQLDAATQQRCQVCVPGCKGSFRSEGRRKVKEQSVEGHQREDREGGRLPAACGGADHEPGEGTSRQIRFSMPLPAGLRASIRSAHRHFEAGWRDPAVLDPYRLPLSAPLCPSSSSPVVSPVFSPRL